MPAGDLDDLARRQPAGLIGGQGDDNAGDVLGRPDSPEGNVGKHFLKNKRTMNCFSAAPGGRWTPAVAGE